MRGREDIERTHQARNRAKHAMSPTWLFHQLEWKFSIREIIQVISIPIAMTRSNSMQNLDTDIGFSSIGVRCERHRFNQTRRSIVAKGRERLMNTIPGMFMQTTVSGRAIMSVRRRGSRRRGVRV
jgi:hypothetical protein